VWNGVGEIFLLHTMPKKEIKAEFFLNHLVSDQSQSNMFTGVFTVKCSTSTVTSTTAAESVKQHEKI
jgi:hypothetical protein